MSEAPSLAGPYALFEKRGQGGMAEVWRATRSFAPGVEKQVAVKRLRPEAAQDPEARAAFAQEAAVALRLNHPQVVTALDADTIGEAPYLVLEWVDGLDLRELMDRLARRGARLPEGAVCAIGLGLTRALGHVHGLRGPDGLPLGLVHQDVGHPNVLISREGAVKLTDFGLTRPHPKGGGPRWGRAGYIAPERLRDEDTDVRSDLFSLGVVLWEALAGQRLFAGPTDADRQRQTLALTAAPPLPGGTFGPQSALQRCLCPDPAGRPAGASALVAELEARACSPEVLAAWVQAAADEGPIPAVDSRNTALQAALLPSQPWKQRLALAALLLSLLVLVWPRPAADPGPVARLPASPATPAAPEEVMLPGGVLILGDPARRAPPPASTPASAVTSVNPAPPAEAPPPEAPAPPPPVEPTAAAEAPAPPPMGKVSITLTQGVGRVSIDGVALSGATPLLGHPLSPGRHRVTVEIRGGRTYVRDIEVVADELVSLSWP